MKVQSATRAMKNRKYIRRFAPQSIPRASLDALEKLPTRVFDGLHATPTWDKVTDDAQLKAWLVANPIPAPRAVAALSSPLFNGTVFFAQVSFVSAGVAPSSISLADMQTIISYASNAVLPIAWYASQYGPCWVAVWPTPIPYIAHVNGGTFARSDLETWVDAIGQFMRSQGISNPCVVIPHNRDLPNSPQNTTDKDPYHFVTDNGTVYVYSLVFAENLTVADNNTPDPNDLNSTIDVYALNLSHELGEMVVDPTIDNDNPEVCDPCATNCTSGGGVNRYSFFDDNALYLGGGVNIRAVAGYSFFINSIVRAGVPLDSGGCIGNANDVNSACLYAPPLVTGQLVAYVDDGTVFNVSAPMVVGLDEWQYFEVLFSGTDINAVNRIYAVDISGELLSYSDSGTLGNVSAPITVGFGGWQDFQFLFGGTDAAGDNRIYAVNANGELLSYGDDGTPGNVSAPITVGFGGWHDFKFLFAGMNAAGDTRIYAVNANGELLSYGDDGTPGNVSAPVTVGFGGWHDFQFLFAGTNDAGDNRIYAVNSNGELLSYGDDGTPGNVSAPVIVGRSDWLEFQFLFAGKNLSGANNIYAVPT
jgi:hypothetical protein